MTHETEQLRVISLGGGVQSTALLVLAAEGKIDFKIALFANTGDDSENPDTLAFVRETLTPWCAERGIAVHELQRRRRDGSVETLYGRMERNNGGAAVIPFKMSETGPPGRRACTSDFKVQVISKWLKAHGATKDTPALVAMGISVDELQRARSKSNEEVQVLDYPLLRLRMDRSDCAAVIRAAGLPVPPKSACIWFPYQTNRRWQELREQHPDRFQKAVDLEEMVNAKRAKLGLSQVFLHNARKPLPMATSANRQGNLFGDDTEDVCETGHCFV